MFVFNNNNKVLKSFHWWELYLKTNNIEPQLDTMSLPIKIISANLEKASNCLGFLSFYLSDTEESIKINQATQKKWKL